jgi:hypothetical protein
LVAILLFGLTLALITACVYVHYGKDDALYQDVKSGVFAIFGAGLIGFFGICVYIPYYIKTTASKIEKIEEEIELLKNR